MTASANADPAAHVHKRLNSPERAKVIEDAARFEAEARAEFERNEAAAIGAHDLNAGKSSQVAETADGVPGVSPNSSAFRPKTLTEVLFNYGASFAGVPGLTPQRGLDGALDEGLGFHQDGTVRKAGGTASASGPSTNGYRARNYMQSGLQNGYGNSFGAGYGQGMSFLDSNPDDPLAWAANDPTRGGRVTGTSGYSRDLSDLDPMSMALDRGLSYGAGLLNSAGEAAISGLVDGGRARLNFHMDKDGYFGGEGDALLPWYDSQYTTVFTQLGARSMHDESDTRWIGNFGIGQRWFPAATEDDAGNWMVGYNAFFDYDFTRDHQRGGIGVEAQYDWLRLASNYYFPLSSWKGSEDFDSDFVKERPAKGWDMRVKGYLPFYRNLAVTGAYSQWYGDHVGMFGASNLEKDPKVWSYGLEYTPVPLVSGFITQKSTERGRTDTEFGLNFTYHFQMPWEDQISHAKVAELRTVSGSKHEFVDRENRIILEYKAKNAYRIEYLGRVGTNTFKFRIMDGFGKYKAGQTVRVSASGVTLAAAPEPEKSFFAQAGSAIVDFFSVSTAHAADFSQTYTTDGNGEFTMRLGDVKETPVTVTVQAGSNTQTFTLTEAELSEGLFAPKTNVTNGETITLSLKTPNPNTNVIWNVSGPGASTISGSSPTDASGNATGTLVVTPTGAGDVTVTTEVAGGKTYTCTMNIAVAYSLELSPPVDLDVGSTETASFILKLNGAAVASTAINLSYSGVGAFDSPDSNATTDGSGNFSLSLKGQTAGAVTITATLPDGKTAACKVSVGGAYVLTLTSTDTLAVGVTRAATFTLQRNGVTVNSKNLTLTYGGTGAFSSPPNSATTNASGVLSLNLTGATAGQATITATWDSTKTATCNVTVAAASYALELATDNTTVAVGGSATMTATLTNHGQNVSGQSVTFTWKVNGGTQTQQTASGTFTTNGSGVATWTLDNTNLDAYSNIHRTVTVTATSNGVTSLAVNVQFGDSLASGVVALNASGGMNWTTANTFCGAQGGSLPTAGMDGKDVSQSGTYGLGSDFGGVGSNSLKLPNGNYWTRDSGTNSSGVSGYWTVGVDSGPGGVDGAYVGVGSGITLYAVCVQ